jgi:RHS repeat-associated protein
LSGTVKVYEQNLHGDLAAIASTASSVTGSQTYKPFGEKSVSIGDSSIFSFQSDPTDPDTALVDLGTRNDDPVQGRFTTQDSAIGNPRSPMSQNQFIYGNDNPISMWDPNGMCAGIDGGDANCGAWDHPEGDQSKYWHPVAVQGTDALDNAESPGDWTRMYAAHLVPPPKVSPIRLPSGQLATPIGPVVYGRPQGVFPILSTSGFIGGLTNATNWLPIGEGNRIFASQYPTGGTVPPGKVLITGGTVTYQLVLVGGEPEYLVDITTTARTADTANLQPTVYAVGQGGARAVPGFYEPKLNPNRPVQSQDLIQEQMGFLPVSAGTPSHVAVTWWTAADDAFPSAAKAVWTFP